MQQLRTDAFRLGGGPWGQDKGRQRKSRVQDTEEGKYQVPRHSPDGLVPSPSCSFLYLEVLPLVAARRDFRAGAVQPGLKAAAPGKVNSLYVTAAH